MAAEKGKSTRPNIKLGICGEHGGDPSSVEFCHNVGLTYVSCSPFRVPIARLAAAQAAIKAKKEESQEKSEEKTTTKDFSEKVGEVAKEVVEETSKVIEAGIAGVKAGFTEAKKTYQNK